MCATATLQRWRIARRQLTVHGDVARGCAAHPQVALLNACRGGVWPAARARQACGKATQLPGTGCRPAQRRRCRARPPPRRRATETGLYSEREREREREGLASCAERVSLRPLQAVRAGWRTRAQVLQRAHQLGACGAQPAQPAGQAADDQLQAGRGGMRQQELGTVGGVTRGRGEAEGRDGHKRHPGRRAEEGGTQTRVAAGAGAMLAAKGRAANGQPGCRLP